MGSSSVAIRATLVAIMVFSLLHTRAMAAVLDEPMEHYNTIELGYAKDIANRLINSILGDHVDQAVDEFKARKPRCFRVPREVVIPAVKFEVRLRSKALTREFATALVQHYDKDQLTRMWREVSGSASRESSDIFEIDRKHATKEATNRLVATVKHQIDWKLLPTLRKYCAQRTPVSP